MAQAPINDLDNRFDQLFKPEPTLPPEPVAPPADPVMSIKQTVATLRTIADALERGVLLFPSR